MDFSPKNYTTIDVFNTWFIGDDGNGILSNRNQIYWANFGFNKQEPNFDIHYPVFIDQKWNFEVIAVS